MKSFIVATAGHVDHGKSALVRALTGMDPDRLPEEKARGITIDLGFAHLDLAPAGAEALRLGIVDVPGHEDFVKNMVAGVGAVDLALIVVAADDGWMPQTEEHVQILAYAGVARAVVALTKIDRASSAEEAVIGAVRQRLAGTPFVAAPIVPTSVVTGRGLDELRSEMARGLSGVPVAQDRGKPRLWIDRVFSVRGAGTVVTGTLTGGTMRTGDLVHLAPAGIVARIRGLQSHHAAVDEAHPGTRTAINLAELTPPGGAGPLNDRIRRGDVITRPELAAVSRTIDAWLVRSPRAPTGRRLEHDTTVWIHCGTVSARARVILAGARGLRAGEAGRAQVRLEDGLAVFAGDRLVLRDAAERQTLAGGVVLEPDGDRKRFQRAAYQQFLRELRPEWDDAAAVVRARLRRDDAVRVEGLLGRSVFSADEVGAAVAEMARTGLAVAVDGFLVRSEAWAAAQAAVRAALEEHHRSHPAQLGLPLAQLRAGAGRAWAARGLFEALVGTLVASDCEQRGAALKLRSHRPEMPAECVGAMAVVRGLLAAHPLDPPGRKELAAGEAAREALGFLVKTREVIELGPEVVITAAALDAARTTVSECLRKCGRATVSELRTALGATRRVTVPLLERLDREGLTRRDGDHRRLASDEKDAEPRSASRE